MIGVVVVHAEIALSTAARAPAGSCVVDDACMQPARRASQESSVSKGDRPKGSKVMCVQGWFLGQLPLRRSIAMHISQEPVMNDLIQAERRLTANKL